VRNAPAYEVRDLVKRYTSPPVLANDGISFEAVAGEAFGLLGPNGAGKSTLVKQLVGLIAPSAGEIRLFGETVRPHRGGDRRIGKTVAYLPQGTLSLGELKVREAVKWTGMLRGLGKAQALVEADQLLERLTISGISDRQTRKLSGGQRRLTHLAMTFVARLPVLILDEPTADIDVALRQTVWDLISERCQAGSTVILVTHDVAEAEHALHRVAIVDQGKVVVGGTPAELKSRLAHRTRLDIVVAEGSALDPRSVAADISDDIRVRGRQVSAWVPADDAIRSLEKIMASGGHEGFEDVRLVTPTLEDVYLDVGGRSMAEADLAEAEGTGDTDE